MTTPSGGIGGLPPTAPVDCPVPDCIPAGEEQFTPQDPQAFIDAYPDLDGRQGGGISQAWLTQGTGCGPIGVAYWCDSDVLVIYGPIPGYDGGVPNPDHLELVTDTGVFQDVPVLDHVDSFAGVLGWQAVRIHDASQYGTEVQSIAFFNQDGTRTCTILKPYGTWNGARWLIGTGLAGCIPTPLDPGPPVPVEFTVTYDGLNTLSIVSPTGIFADIVTMIINFDGGTFGPFQSDIIDVLNDTSANINVSNVLGTDPFIMYQMFITDGDGNLLGSWNGMIPVNQ